MLAPLDFTDLKGRALSGAATPHVRPRALYTVGSQPMSSFSGLNWLENRMIFRWQPEGLYPKLRFALRCVLFSCSRNRLPLEPAP